MTDPIDSYVDRAIAWATARLGNPDYAFRCLAFVEDAYEAGNAIEIFGGSTAKESADEYASPSHSRLRCRAAPSFSTT